MSQLLEILGRAITIDTTELIWHWVNAVAPPIDDSNNGQYYQLNKAIELLGEQKTEASTEQLRLYLFENPDCTYGRLISTAIFLHNNQIQEAINELNSVYMREPNNTMALYVLGYCYERLGREAQAIEYYQDCLKFKRYLQLPAQRLAAIYFKNGQLEKTIQQYVLLKNEYPDDISALITLGHLYIATEQYSEAIETFNSAVLMHPDNFIIQDEKIEQLIAEKNLHEALEYVCDLLQDQPYRSDLLMKHGDILRMMGSPTEAIEQYEEAVRLCPDFLEATIKLGTLYLQMQQEQLAAIQFNKAVEINDNIIDAYTGLVIAQYLAGHLSDALSTLSLAAAIQPNSSLLFSEMAAIHFKLSLKNSNFFIHDIPQDLTKSVIDAHYQQIVKRPHNPDLYYRLGILFMNIIKFTDAIDCFYNALEINPLFFRARSKLSLCLFQTGRYEDSLNCLSKMNSYDKELLELYYKTAILYCDKVKFASSLLNLEHLLENNYASPEASVNVSIILQNLGLLDRTTAMWDNLVDTVSNANNPDYQF